MGSKKRLCLIAMTISVYHFRLFILVVILTVLDYFILVTIDSMMSVYIVGYKVRASYVAPLIIFFIIVYISSNFGIKYGWVRILPHIYIGVAVFFPLIYFTSYWEITRNLPVEIKQQYLSVYCHSSVDVEKVCGKALAHMVFSRAISTVPLLLFIPALFYGLMQIGFFKQLSSNRKHD